MVKIAVMVSSYTELQFDISEEINFKTETDEKDWVQSQTWHP